MKKFVEIAKERHKVSQNGLAKMLSITGGGLSHIANGGSTSQETLVKLARLCGEKPEKLLAEYELSKEHSPEVKTMWERIAGKATAAVTTLGIPLLPLFEYGATVNEYIYYVK